MEGLERERLSEHLSEFWHNSFGGCGKERNENPREGRGLTSTAELSDRIALGSACPPDPRRSLVCSPKWAVWVPLMLQVLQPALTAHKCEDITVVFIII